MKISKKLFFSAFSCAFALGASAQENGTYLKKDVLTNEICTLTGYKVVEHNTGVAHYAAILMQNGQSIAFDGKEDLTHGIVANSEVAVLENIEFEWVPVAKDMQPKVLFYTKPSLYNSVTELGGIPQAEIVYQQPMFTPWENVKYWGLKKDIQIASFKSITVTWHLAYFRENLTVGNLGTICLPYDVKAEDLADELTAYTITGKVMNSTREQVEALVFEEVDEMKAGVAYLFVPKKSGICLKYYGTEVQQPVESKYGLIGSFENYTFTEDDCRDNNLFLISNNSIRLAGAGAGVGANRAYIKMSKEMPEYHETNSSRKLLVSANGYIETGDSPTIVEMLKAIASLKDGQNQTSTAYDLQGRMVSGTSAKGIVIENGKKKYISVR